MFSASDAAFSRFRAGREHFRTLLAWIPILAVMSLVMPVIMIVLAGPSLAAFASAGASAETDPQATLALLAPMLKMYAVLLPYMLIYYALLYSAVNRLMLRPSERGLAYFAFGADEFRQLGLMILLFLLFFAIYVVAVVVMTIVVGLVTAAVPRLAPLGVAVGVIAALALMFTISVRLSLASAQTFATRKINLFGSWRLTRGHFWSMVGAYLLSIILTIIVFAAVFAILALVMFMLGGGFKAISDIMGADMSSLQAYFTPTMLIYQIGLAIFSPFIMLIMSCPAPEIYRSLVGAGGPASTFD